MKFLTTLFLSFFFFIGANAQVHCTDCPNNLFINGILTSQIEIINPGPDDIGQNPLQEICVTLQHSWLSDAVISIESPDGLHYVLLGDDDNDWGGCWSGSEDNVNVCFVLGSDAPLTPGEPYGTFCSGVDYCLEGDYTPACGPLAYTPDLLGEAAPNCDINDYNVTGNTISGIWTMRVYCLCMAEGDPELTDWSLHFLDGNALTTGSSSFCNAYGGTGPTNLNAFACNTPNEMVDFIPLVGSGQEIPTDLEYGYGIIAVGNNGFISNFFDVSSIEISGWNIGEYLLYGISYNDVSVSQLLSYVGLPFDELIQNQGVDVAHCYSLSETPKTLLVENQIILNETHALCHGEALELYGETITTLGEHTIEINNSSNCDEFVVLNIIPDDGVSFEAVYPRVCPGESVEITAENGVQFLWRGPDLSILGIYETLILNNPDEDDSGTYTCEIISSSGCSHIQEFDLSLRCETRMMAIEMGTEISMDFDNVVSTSDECNGDDESAVSIGISDQSVVFWGQNEGHELICIQAYEDGLLKNLTYDVTVENVLGTKEPQIALDIQPNPASDYLQINAFDVVIGQVLIYDTKGALVKQVAVNNSYKSISVNDLSAGLYMLTIQTEKGVLNRKVVIN